MSDKSDAVAALESARQELLAAVEGLKPEQMTVPMLGEWSVKDILAHVAMWREMELLDMRRAVRGARPALERFDYSFIDQWNHIQFVLRKPFPVEQVLAELSETRRAITQFLFSMPNEQLATGYIPLACMHSIRHDQRHTADIRSWRQQ